MNSANPFCVVVVRPVRSSHCVGGAFCVGGSVSVVVPHEGQHSKNITLRVIFLLLAPLAHSDLRSSGCRPKERAAALSLGTRSRYLGMPNRHASVGLPLAAMCGDASGISDRTAPLSRSKTCFALPPRAPVVRPAHGVALLHQADTPGAPPASAKHAFRRQGILWPHHQAILRESP